MTSNFATLDAVTNRINAADRVHNSKAIPCRTLNSFNMKPYIKKLNSDFLMIKIILSTSGTYLHKKNNIRKCIQND